jgi:hypothetical protein
MKRQYKYSPLQKSLTSYVYSFLLQQNKITAVEITDVLDYLCKHSKMNINNMLNVAVPSTG